MQLGDQTLGAEITIDFRKLFRELRAILRAESGSTQERMQSIVELIALHFHAEVCSLYQVDPVRGVLVLRATRGLRREAIGNTVLRPEEGLVGTIASSRKPLSLADAQSDKRFSFRPETGEEIYRSFLGVPLIRADKLHGVLVLQHRAERHHCQEEVEHFETVAQFLSEMLQQLSREAVDEVRPADMPMFQLPALPLSPGLAMGKVVFHLKDIVIRRWKSSDPAPELARLEIALQDLEETLQSLLQSQQTAEDRETQELLEADLMLARDKGWRDRIAIGIGNGLTAEAAVQSVREDIRARMNSVSNDYIRERLLDLDDLSHRLLANLTGQPHGLSLQGLPAGSILVCRSLGTSELLQMRKANLAGLVVVEATPSAHLAIIARSLKIPALGQVVDALTELSNGDTVILDALSGQLIARPNAALRVQSERRIALRERSERQERTKTSEPCKSRDGVELRVMANAGLLFDLDNIVDLQTDGIGLFRTELAFLVETSFPSLEDQVRLYREVYERMGDKPVVFRTLDIGSDKQLPYFKENLKENNPALGWRAIRISLDRPDMLSEQLLALLLAADGRPLRVMFPMVGTVEEFDAARALLTSTLDRHLEHGGQRPHLLEVGVMIEVPALLWDLERLLKRADFASLGTNDLFQFLLAADRDNPRTGNRFEILSPVHLRILTEVADAAARLEKPIGVCGELCALPLGVLALVGCGYRSFSMSSAQIPAIKSVIRALDVGILRERIQALSQLPTGTLRDQLAATARDFGLEAT